MSPNKFRFVKVIRRNDWTIIFGRMGKRRLVSDYKKFPVDPPKRSKLEKIRHANMGTKFKKFARVHKFKIFMSFGMEKRKPISRFRR